MDSKQLLILHVLLFVCWKTCGANLNLYVNDTKLANDKPLNGTEGDGLSLNSNNGINGNNSHHSPKIVITYFSKPKARNHSTNYYNVDPLMPFHKFFLFFLLNAHRNDLIAKDNGEDNEIGMESTYPFVSHENILINKRNNPFDFLTNVTEENISNNKKQNLSIQLDNTSNKGLENSKSIGVSDHINDTEINSLNITNSIKIRETSKTENATSISNWFSEDDIIKEIRDRNITKRNENATYEGQEITCNASSEITNNTEKVSVNDESLQKSSSMLTKYQTSTESNIELKQSAISVALSYDNNTFPKQTLNYDFQFDTTLKLNESNLTPLSFENLNVQINTAPNSSGVNESKIETIPEKLDESLATTTVISKNPEVTLILTNQNDNTKPNIITEKKIKKSAMLDCNKNQTLLNISSEDDPNKRNRRSHSNKSATINPNFIEKISHTNGETQTEAIHHNTSIKKEDIIDDSKDIYLILDEDLELRQPSSISSLKFEDKSDEFGFKGEVKTKLSTASDENFAEKELEKIFKPMFSGLDAEMKREYYTSSEDNSEEDKHEPKSQHPIVKVTLPTVICIGFLLIVLGFVMRSSWCYRLFRQHSSALIVERNTNEHN